MGANCVENSAVDTNNLETLHNHVRDVWKVDAIWYTIITSVLNTDICSNIILNEMYHILDLIAW